MGYDSSSFPVFYCARQTTSVRGYTLPAGTRVQALLSQIHRDPKHFTQPDKFDPERFLDHEGCYRPSPALVPFGVGKRECLGKQLALQVL